MLNFRMDSNPEKAWYRTLSRTQWAILAIAWCGWVFDIMDTALFNFAKGPMLTEMLGGPAAYKLNGPAIEGRIQTFFLIGWAVGGLFFGLLADRWGRTRTLVVTVLMYCSLTGLTALCRTPDQVLVARFLTALGIGGEWAAGAALVAESLPNRARVGASSILQSAAAFGPWFAAFANLGLVGHSWRMLFLVGVAPAALTVFIRSKTHEPSVQRERMGFVEPIRILFSDPVLRRNVLVAMGLGVVGIAGAGTAPFWLPNLVKSASGGMLPTEVAARTSYATLTLHVGTLLGVFVFPALAERIGRRLAFALFFVMSPASVALALYGGADYGRILVLMPLAAFFAIGLSAGFVLYFPELFPPSVRATGSGLAYNVGRIVSAPLPLLTGAIIGHFNGNVVAGVLIASGIYVLGLLVIPFAPETRGRPLPVEVKILEKIG